MAKKSTKDNVIAPITWDIFPKDRTKNKITISLEPGECLFVVGANGSGKTALMQQFIRGLSPDKTTFMWYSAHRQPWFDSEAVWTGETKENREQRLSVLMQAERSPDSRWKKPTNDHVKHELVFNQFLEGWRAFDNGIRQTQNADNLTVEQKITKIERMEKLNPITRLNKLIKHGNVPVEFEPGLGNSVLIARHIDNKAPVNIRELSDGERFALLFAVTTLTLPAGSVLLIDEPDLHFHQSIIDSFFSALVASRENCFFVFSTHNLSLPAAHPESKTIVVRSCEWTGNAPSRFDANLIDSKTPIPENVRQDILGGRKKMLFVEGEEWSLDTRLYSKIYPEVQVVPKKGCNRVDKTVVGLRESEDIHNVSAYGLVDKDMRDSAAINDSIKRKVGVFKLWSVESLYYCSEAIGAVARHQASKNIIPRNSTNVYHVLPAVYKALGQKNATEKVALRLTKYKTKAYANEQINNVDFKSQEVDSRDLKAPIPIYMLKTYNDELDKFLTHIEKAVALTKKRTLTPSHMSTRNWNSFLEAYPVHLTGAFQAIAQSLKLDKKGYENILLSLVQEDEGLARSLKKYIRMPPDFEE